MSGLSDRLFQERRRSALRSTACAYITYSLLKLERSYNLFSSVDSLSFFFLFFIVFRLIDAMKCVIGWCLDNFSLPYDFLLQCLTGTWNVDGTWALGGPGLSPTTK